MQRRAIPLLLATAALAFAGPHDDHDPPMAKGRVGSGSKVTVEVRGEWRYIASNGLPDHATGQFPNRGNPSAIAPQKHEFRVPAKPAPASQPVASRRGASFGVAVNGVPFDPGTAEFWNGDPTWKYEAMTGYFGRRGKLGMDRNLAHVQPNGAYHYHGLPIGLLEHLDYKKKVAFVGWAADGYPIYGPFGHADARDPLSPLKELKSGYQLKKGTRAGGPGGTYDGSFASDYEWTDGAGDLDRLNGREGVTPEFPAGTFHYVLTADWPFIPRLHRGPPDASFDKGPPGGGPGGKGKKMGGKKGPPPE